MHTLAYTSELPFCFVHATEEDSEIVVEMSGFIYSHSGYIVKFCDCSRTTTAIRDYTVTMGTLWPERGTLCHYGAAIVMYSMEQTK